MVATAQVASERAPDGRRHRWTEHRTQRRASLVRAGIAAIDTYGLDASADQIAATAGVSRTVLYRYFKDKDDLQQAISQELVKVVLASLVPALHTGATANEVIRGTITVLVGWLDEHRNLYEFLQSRGRVSGALEAVEATMADQVAGVLGAFIMWFGLEADVAEPGAYSLVGMVESASVWWLRHRPMSREKFIDFISAAVWHLLDGFLRDHGVEMDPDVPLPIDLRVNA